MAGFAGPQHHVRQARMKTEQGHRAAMGREPALMIDRVEIAEQRAGLRVGGGGRRVEPGERGRIASAPARELQGDRRQIGLEDLRRREWRQQALLVLGPEAIANAGLEPTGAPAALFGSRLGNPLCDEPGHARSRIEAGPAHQARVDHHTNAVDG